MKINSVEIKISAVRTSQYPEDNKPEFLIVGKSNVGKSSFINTLMNRKNFAKTSSRPGKTQTLNFYYVNESFYLVDVPGYGYALTSKTIQEKFGKMVEDYLTNRKNLEHVFMLIDFRHKPSKNDILMYNYLKYYNLPVTIVATKIDKISKTQWEKYKQVILKELDIVHGDNLVLFSSLSKDGKKEIHDMIEEHI